MAMRDKAAPKHDDPGQSKRFVDAAREAKADESEEGADRAFSQVAKQKPETKKPRR
jgi:hypothetical protein